MIYVDRSRVVPPLKLIDPSGEGQKEKAKAIAFYKRRANRTKSYKKFNMYRHREVKEALETLFHKKCAYCEFSYKAGMPVEVEHYRPKGRIDPGNGKLIKPGYYWLASDWDNLLPSCIDCNRERNQIEKPSGKIRKGGKADYFPVAGRRATCPGEEKDERPFLLNPCIDRPSHYLEFFEDEQGRKGLIRSRFKSGFRSVRAEQSINIYGLWRPGLVEDRAERLLLLEKELFTVKRNQERLKKRLPLELKLDFKDEYLEAIKNIKKACQDDSPYAAMNRQYVKKFIRTNADRSLETELSKAGSWL